LAVSGRPGRRPGEQPSGRGVAGVGVDELGDEVGERFGERQVVAGDAELDAVVGDGHGAAGEFADAGDRLGVEQDEQPRDAIGEGQGGVAEEAINELETGRAW
jgi:hypothetical protein